MWTLNEGYKKQVMLNSIKAYYLAALTAVCTDTLAQWPGMVRVGGPVPGAAQDALPRLQPRPEWAHVGLVLYCTVLYCNA